MHPIDREVFNITRAQLRVLEPVRAVTAFQDATMGPFDSFGLSILTVQDKDGNLGEAPVFNTYINILEKCFLPILFHNHDLPYEKLYRLLYWSIRNEGFRGQASALLGQLDLALFDLAARRKGLPLYRYLGGTRDSVKMYGSGGGTNYSLEELEKEMKLFLDAGVDCVKIKVGSQFGTKMERDIERVRFVRSLIGGEVKLAVDANQTWSTDQALAFIDKVGIDDIAWVEEPIHSAHYLEIEKLCRLSPVPIAYGESERTAKMFPSLVHIGVAHLQPVPTQLGGIKEWAEVRDLAIKNGLDLTSGGYSFYTAPMLATAPDDCAVEYLYSLMYGLERYFMVRPVWHQGRFKLPDIEGVPVRIDWGYWEKADKIIVNRVWTKDQLSAYNPTVTM